MTGNLKRTVGSIIHGWNTLESTQYFNNILGPTDSDATTLSIHKKISRGEAQPDAGAVRNAYMSFDS